MLDGGPQRLLLLGVLQRARLPPPPPPLPLPPPSLCLSQYLSEIFSLSMRFLLLNTISFLSLCFSVSLLILQTRQSRRSDRTLTLGQWGNAMGWSW